MKRREFLTNSALLGLGLVLLPKISISKQFFTFKNNKTMQNKMFELLKYATKAQSGHNTQPWKFYVDDKQIEILPDFRYELPVVDPEHRELYISLGCALANLEIAAQKMGFKTLTKIEEQDNYHKIVVDLEETAPKNHALFDAISKRQVNREEYNGKPISDELLAYLKESVPDESINLRFISNEKDKEKVKALIEKGNEIQMQDKDFKKELISWMRFNKKALEKHGDGLSYKVMGFPAVPDFLGKLIMKSSLNPKAQNKRDMKALESSPVYALFTTKQNVPSQWIKLGRTFQEFSLQAYKKNIQTAHHNQPNEIKALAEELKQVLSIEDEHPQLLVRMGYAEETAYSPRRAVTEVINHTKPPSK